MTCQFVYSGRHCDNEATVDQYEAQGDAGRDWVKVPLCESHAMAYDAYRFADRLRERDRGE